MCEENVAFNNGQPKILNSLKCKVSGISACVSPCTGSPRSVNHGFGLVLKKEEDLQDSDI